MEARECNCSTLKEPEISPLRKRALEMKSAIIKDLLIAAYPERAALIKSTRLKPSKHDPDD